MKTRVISVLLSIWWINSGLGFAPDRVPSWANNHTYVRDGEFYFESYHPSGETDWNRQVISSWHDTIPQYRYEEDYQLMSGDYYLGWYNWGISPARLTETLNGVVIGLYLQPDPMVRYPYATAREVCRSWSGMDPEGYSCFLDGSTITRLAPPSSPFLMNYIYKISLTASAYGGGVPFHPYNEPRFTTAQSPVYFTVASRSAKSDGRFYMALPGNAQTDITPNGRQELKWYNYSVNGSKVVLSVIPAWLASQHIAPAESQGAGMNAQKRQDYIDDMGDDLLGRKISLSGYYCHGFQLLAASAPALPCFRVEWKWHQDIEDKTWHWTPLYPNDLMPGGGRTELKDSPMNPGNDDEDVRHLADALPDVNGWMHLLDAPGFKPDQSYFTLRDGTWTVKRLKGEAWLTWPDEVSALEGIGAYQEWSAQIVLKKLGGAPTLVSTAFSPDASLYKLLTLEDMRKIAGAQ